MGAKVLILKVVSHNNRLKDLKLKLKVSNMFSYIFHDKAKVRLSLPIMFSQQFKLQYICKYNERIANHRFYK